MTIRAVHHLQLAMPPGQEDQARAFYSGILGFRELPKPERLARRGGVWFSSGSAEVHLGVEQGFRPATKAHPAFLVDDLATLIARCGEAGHAAKQEEPLSGFERAYVADPFGNRIELLQPNGSFILRKLDLDDAEAWAVLRREALEAHPLAFGASIPDDPKLLVESIRTRLASGEESTVFGAFIDVSLIGIIGIVRNASRKERHKSLIWGMYVTPGSRQTGAGQMLLRAAIEQARSWTGVEQVHLAVSEVAIEARRLYERNGFQAWGCEPRALSLNGNCADETHMYLDLRKFNR